MIIQRRIWKCYGIPTCVCHRRPLICSVCLSHNPINATFMAFHWIFSMNYMTGVYY